MKRSGFTMIELVFVIVILGILASVAIPKLAATRDDANIAKATSEVSSLISDLGSYYTSRGSMDTNVSKMTNVKLYTDNAGTTEATSVTYNASTGFAPAVHYVDTKRDKACLDIVINDINGTVTLSKNSTDADKSVFCKGLATALTETSMLKTYTFGGSSIYGQ